MQNKTDWVGVTLPEKIKQKLTRHRRLLGLSGAALAGYAMAGSFLLGGVSPFGVALCAALSVDYSLAAAFGAVLGYLFAPGVAGNIKYIAAVLLVGCAKWLFSSKGIARRYELAASVLTGFVALGIAGTATLLLSGATPYDLIRGVAELFLCCGAAYFFARALACVPLGWQGASRADVSCVVVACSVVLMGFSEVRIATLSVGRIAAVLIVLICARYAGEAGGAISGITAGVALGLAGGDYAYAIGAYGFGGLVAGVFGHMGRIAVAAAFIVVNTVTALLSKEYSQVYTAIFEIFVASLAFVAVPGSLAAKLRLEGLGQGQTVPDDVVQGALRDRLGDIAGALRNIGATTRQVSSKLSEMEEDGYAGLEDQVAEVVCGRCGMRTACWNFRYTTTMNAFCDCIDLLKEEGGIAREKCPKHFVQTCCKLDELIRELTAQFQSRVARQGVQRKVSKVRAVVTDQFEGMAQMLEEISAELGAVRLLEPQKTARVREYFRQAGFSMSRVLCAADEFGRAQVELTIPSYQAVRMQKTRTTLDLCGLLDADFDLPQAAERDKLITYVYTEKATYTVELGAYQLASGGNRLCGDAYDFVRNKSGSAHFVISDGMGSGGSAAVDSAMACGLLCKLIAVGVGHEAALKMVNSALLIKSGEESLATVDVTSLDLFTGKAQFYKAGAAPTFIVKNGKAGYVESASLPAGILHGISFEQSGMTLHEGDVVVMVSDGVVVTGTDWIKSELNELKDMDMQKLCEKLAVTAKMRRTDGHEDDITVVAAALRKGR